MRNGVLANVLNGHFSAQPDYASRDFERQVEREYDLMILLMFVRCN